VLVITTTVIGYGSPNKAGKSASHGSPLGKDEVELTKKALNWNYEETFYIPEEVKQHMLTSREKGIKKEEEWNKLFAAYEADYPGDAKLFSSIIKNDFSSDWVAALPKFEDPAEAIATRQASGKVINAIKDYLPTLIGGSADLAGSNNTSLKGEDSFSFSTPGGRNVNYGIREHAMGSIMNGMALFGGIIPFAGTFLIFSDYMRPAIRMASLCKLQTIYVFTHDSIGLGEDGPTHQPVEQLSSLRAIPGLTVIRPSDPAETSKAWEVAIKKQNGPVALALTRQKVKNLDRTKFAPADGLLKGAYVVKPEKGNLDVIIVASGSELELAIDSAYEFEKSGKGARVVSFPSWELFEQQSAEYKESVFPKNVKKRIVIEAGIRQGWERYIGDEGEYITIETFGASAPAEILFEKYGFSLTNVMNKLGKMF